MTIPKKIEVIYAWIVTETDGSEGIPAQLLGNVWAPLIGADMERVNSARNSPTLEAIRAMKRPHKLVKFTVMTVLENYP
jgi:hypothetical protein